MSGVGGRSVQQAQRPNTKVKQLHCRTRAEASAREGADRYPSGSSGVAEVLALSAAAAGQSAGLSRGGVRTIRELFARPADRNRSKGAAAARGGVARRFRIAD